MVLTFYRQDNVIDLTGSDEESEPKRFNSLQNNGLPRHFHMSSVPPRLSRPPILPVRTHQRTNDSLHQPPAKRQRTDTPPAQKESYVASSSKPTNATRILPPPRPVYQPPVTSSHKTEQQYYNEISKGKGSRTTSAGSIQKHGGSTGVATGHQVARHVVTEVKRQFATHAQRFTPAIRKDIISKVEQAGPICAFYY